MKLKDTIQMMQSADYKERFKAEYYQLLLRYQKLKEILLKWDRGELEFILHVHEAHTTYRLMQ